MSSPTTISLCYNDIGKNRVRHLLLQIPVCEDIVIINSDGPASARHQPDAGKSGTMENEMNMDDLKKGDMIFFGRYPQKKGPSADAEPIEWIVLETDGKTAKLLSRYGLTAKPYDKDGWWPVVWENCTLRKWLNGEFLNAAFTDEEKQRLVNVNIEPECFPFLIEMHDTVDKVFILDDEEVEKYFKDYDERICIPTEKAIGEGAYVGENRGSGCWWWLRTPSISMANFIYVVDTDGSFDKDGFPVDAFGENDHDNIVVRPAIVLNLD